MTTTHTNLALVGGDVYLQSTENSNRTTYHLSNDKNVHVLASTAKLEGIPQLDRKHFVKPKVDVEELAWKKYPDEHDSYYKRQAFEDGYNFKEAEFTREDMEACWLAAQKKMNDFNESGFSKFMNELRPLSLPKSIDVDDDFNVKNVIW